MKKITSLFKRWLPLLVIGLLLIACGAEAETPVAEPSPTPNEAASQATAAMSASATILADGIMQIAHPSVITMSASGIVKSVHVSLGEEIEAGDMLIQLDDSTAILDVQNAELQVVEAEQNVTVAQINLAASKSDLAQNLDGIYSSISDAQENLVEAKNAVASPDEQDAILQYRINVDRTYRALRDLEDEYNKLVEDQNACEGVACQPITNRIIDVVAAIVRAREDHNLAVSQYESAVENLEQGVENAEDRIDSLEYGISQTQDQYDLETGPVRTAERNLASAELALQRAQITLEQAQANLARLTLLAPWSGIVTSLEVATGSLVGSGSPVISLLNTEQLEFHTTNFSERDLNQITLGQRAEIILKAYPTETLAATILRIGWVAGTPVGDAATFPVVLILDGSDLEIRPGMTGRVEILTGE